jgi:hypothetical protein
MRKFKEHYPNWDWTYSLDRIVEEMVEGVASLQRA